MRIFLGDLEYTFGSSEPLESFLVKGVCSESVSSSLWLLVVPRISVG